MIFISKKCGLWGVGVVCHAFLLRKVGNYAWSMFFELCVCCLCQLKQILVNNSKNYTDIVVIKVRSCAINPFFLVDP